MRPVNDFAEARAFKSVTVALTGDGKAEADVLKAMAERYNGKENALKLPEQIALLGHGNKTTGLMTGYSALRAIQTYVSIYGSSKFIFLLDVEHIADPKNIKVEITRSLSTLGYSSLNVEMLSDQACLVSCNLGAHDIFIFVVVSGKERCIEENIAALILIEHNIRVAPNKQGVRLFLNRRGISLYKLIKNSKLNNLKVAFKDLVAVFESMEKNLA